VLKLCGAQAALAFHAVHVLCGLGVLFLGFSLMRRLGVSRAVAAALSLWFVTSPAFAAYENWLFYSLPLAFLVALSAWLLERFLRDDDPGASSSARSASSGPAEASSTCPGSWPCWLVFAWPGRGGAA
jgi:hypothetical protein